jgi:hypothetical protein
MTARTQRHDVIEIISDPTEDTETVKQDYIKELETHGHVIVGSPRYTLDDSRKTDTAYRCNNCRIAFRTYYDFTGRQITIFSDFTENHQCSKRQMNIISLLGTSGSTGR